MKTDHTTLDLQRSLKVTDLQRSLKDTDFQRSLKVTDLQRSLKDTDLQRSLKDTDLHCVPKKTCDYIFYNNFNNKCPITIIFGIDTSKSMSHRKMVSFPTSPI